MTDLFIKNGSLPNFSELKCMKLFQFFSLKIRFGSYITETWIFEITAEATGNFKISMNFNIPLISPPRGQLICEISSYVSDLLNIQCSRWIVRL